MIDTRDIMCKVGIWSGILFVVVLAASAFIGAISDIYRSPGSGTVAAASRGDEVAWTLEEGSPRHSIPKGMSIVAACSGDYGVFAYVVRDEADGSHYLVGLDTRTVKRIEAVGVVEKTMVKGKTR